MVHVSLNDKKAAIDRTIPNDVHGNRIRHFMGVRQDGSGFEYRKSEFMEKIIDLNWFHFFSRLELNGIFILVVIIDILMIVFRLARLWSPKK